MHQLASSKLPCLSQVIIIALHSTEASRFQVKVDSILLVEIRTKCEEQPMCLLVVQSRGPKATIQYFKRL
jgi:hypothetical protein